MSGKYPGRPVINRGPDGREITFQPTSAEVVDISSDDAQYTSPVLLYVGTFGDVKVDMAGLGTGIVFANFGPGEFPHAVTKVWKTGTSALNIVALHDSDTALLKS